MGKKEIPRLLVISNSCISQNDSNGRTLRNFLVGWDSECLAQFYVNVGDPDFSVCSRYYNITDNQALISFIKGKTFNGRLIEQNDTQKSSSGEDKKIKRNAITMSLRNAVWDSKRWRGNQFYEWLDDFHPEMVLLQVGDCTFTIKLALEVSKKYKVPLIVYNSESYYFKSFDYFRARGLAHLFYHIFHLEFRRQYKKLMKNASQTIYICEMLQQQYDKEFGRPSVSIYTASEVKPTESFASNITFTTSYLGNLGVGRHKGLIHIAEALQQVSPKLYLDIYGRIPNEEVRDAFNSCKGIRYKGFVSYEEVVRLMAESDLLVHTENFSDFYREDLKYAFSTKIADYLASGTAFLLYAPDGMACTDYLKKNKAAHIATNKDELDDMIRKVVRDREFCMSPVPRALEIAKSNHSAEQNQKLFQNLLKEQYLYKGKKYV